MSTDEAKLPAPPTPSSAADVSGSATEVSGKGDAPIEDGSAPKKKKVKRKLNKVEKNSRSPCEVRVAVIGNVDSGKSTIVGVLTSGINDDGRGSARQRVLRHGHELDTGRTSALSHQMVGYGKYCEPVHGVLPPGAKPKQKTEAWSHIVNESHNVVSFIDLAGHEKYLKTTISGLTGSFPDYAMIVIGSNMGVSAMTKEHLQVAVALEIPVFVVITKIDICPASVLKSTKKQLSKIMKSPSCGKMTLTCRELGHVRSILKKDIELSQICPVIEVSSVTGTGLDRLNLLLRKLPPTQRWMHPLSEMVSEMNANLERRAAMAMLPKMTHSGGTIEEGSANDGNGNEEKKGADGEEEEARLKLAMANLKLGNVEGISGELEIDDMFQVKGVGIVISGTVTAGKICQNQRLYLGPLSDGSFKEIQVKTMHMKRCPVEWSDAGETCSIAFRFVRKKDSLDRSQIRRGMVAVSDVLKPRPAWGFRATVTVLHHPTTIGCGYQPVVHSGGVRQSATIVRMTKERLRSGDNALIDFKFIREPEFLHLNRAVIIREGSTKCIGRVIRIYDDFDPRHFEGSFIDYISAKDREKRAESSSSRVGGSDEKSDDRGLLNEQKQHSSSASAASSASAMSPTGKRKKGSSHASSSSASSTSPIKSKSGRKKKKSGT